MRTWLNVQRESIENYALRTRADPYSKAPYDGLMTFCPQLSLIKVIISRPSLIVTVKLAHSGALELSNGSLAI